MSNTFAETRNLFTMYVGYVRPLSYDEWKALPDSHKSAALFVQFYDEITLAWYKLKTTYSYVPDEDGVSTMCQYLEKNVSRILADPKKFSPAYIYTVAYNCLYCITHDKVNLWERNKTEISNITYSDNGDELDLFDTVADTKSAEDASEEESFKKMFWQVIEDSSLETQKVVNYLINGESLNKKRANSPDYNFDTLRDVRVKLDQVEGIVNELRTKLVCFLDSAEEPAKEQTIEEPAESDDAIDYLEAIMAVAKRSDTDIDADTTLKYIAQKIESYLNQSDNNLQ